MGNGLANLRSFHNSQTTEKHFDFSKLDLDNMTQTEIDYIKYMWLSTSPIQNYYRSLEY